MDINVRYEGDDDPAKCTARRLAKFDELTLHRSAARVPAGVVLDPHAEQALSPADAPAADALVALDCSWETASREAFGLDGPHRALPFLVAANPVNFGTPFQLNTAEALAGALYIMGFPERASGLLEYFSWGETFLELNAEPLDRYAAAPDSTGVVAIQGEYLAAGREEAES